MGFKMQAIQHKRSTFDFNTQQDVAEILQIILDKLKGVSLAGIHLLYNTEKTTGSGNKCFCSSVSELSLDIETLPVSANQVVN